LALLTLGVVIIVLVMGEFWFDLTGRLPRPSGFVCTLALRLIIFLGLPPIMFLSFSPLIMPNRTKNFRFEHFWFEYADTLNIVKSSLNCTPHRQLMDIPTQLQNVTRNFSSWKKNVLGRLEDNLKEVKRKFDRLELADSNGSISEAEIVELGILYKRHSALLRQICTNQVLIKID